MANVLPTEVRTRVWRLYRARFIFAGALALIGTAALFTLTLMPSFFALHDLVAQSQIAQKQAAADSGDEAALTLTQSVLTTLASQTGATTTPSTTISSALAARPSAILVTHLTYTTGRGSGTLTISGTSKKRDAIASYRDALRKDPHFASVSVPVSDLAGALDGRFSMTVTGKF